MSFFWTSATDEDDFGSSAEFLVPDISLYGARFGLIDMMTSRADMDTVLDVFFGQSPLMIEFGQGDMTGKLSEMLDISFGSLTAKSSIPDLSDFAFAADMAFASDYMLDKPNLLAELQGPQFGFSPMRGGYDDTGCIRWYVGPDTPFFG